MTQYATTTAIVGANIGGSHKFGYDIAEHDPRRPTRPSILQNEDWTLDPSRRRKVVSSSRDLFRNFSLVTWAIRKHQDYVSKFTFQSKVGDQERDPRFAAMAEADPEGFRRLNRQIEELVWEWSQPGNLEVTERFSLDQFMRLTEAGRVIDGDVGILKLQNGMLQPILGDRIRSEIGMNTENVIHGVRINEFQKPIGYRVCRRTRSGNFVFEREIDAKNMILHGYFTSFEQVRGISPLIQAIRSFTDVYDSFDYALVKAKISQLLGFKFTTATDSLDDLGEDERTEEMNRRREYRRKVLKGKAAYMLEMSEGEDAEMIESTTPSNQFQDYMRLIIMVSLKALDIPFGMFDETKGNFYGNRSGIVQYVESCESKRADNAVLLTNLTRWRLAFEVLRGRLVLPAGMTVSDLYLVWTPNGLPWWDAEKESKGLYATVQYGFASHSEICQKMGKDFFEVCRQRKIDEDYARSLGITLPTMTASQDTTVNVSM